MTNPSSTASEIATWSSAAVAPIGVWIAFLVYRLNADRFYLDTFDKRWNALREVFEAASSTIKGDVFSAVVMAAS